MQTNARVNIRRKKTPTDLAMTETWYPVESDIPVWFQLKKRQVMAGDLEAHATDAEMRVGAGRDVRQGDVVERIPDTEKRYRITDLSEILSARGTLTGFTAKLVRDTATE